jgi:DNA mismatch repair protein MutS2
MANVFFRFNFAFAFMQLFPGTVIQQLEFDKIRQLLSGLCRTPYAREKALLLPVLDDRNLIVRLLAMADEYKMILSAGLHLPNDYVQGLSQELRLLGIPGAVLNAEQLMQVRKLAESAGNIFQWFDSERRQAYPALSGLLDNCYYEKLILQIIDEVLDENGKVRDNASEELFETRTSLSKKRAELRRQFDRIAERMQKKGYLAEIAESFMNGRRVLAVFAENKRLIKGVLHAESDSRRTAFIEPEETTELNNEVFSLENQESKEVYRILRQLTADLSIYAFLLKQYLEIAGELDLQAAKARFAIDTDSSYPAIEKESLIDIRKAYHPLLLLYNRKAGKPTIPVDLRLDQESRILVISGPNAGGKTVTLKTVGLLQVMLQSGLLVPVAPDSRMGIFKQMMLHLGDTQSIEFELSTYSSQLKNMKHFTENANGRTLFFIDELGSGSDPNLGGAFAEVILEALAERKALGVVTTHYLNLKIMASKVEGMINGAMQFDEVSLMPLYQLIIGKPGSSYTFAIAERIGLSPELIRKARALVDNEQFRLDKLLITTEKQLRLIQEDRNKLQDLIRQNEKLRKEMQQTLDQEKHRREVELLKQKNRISEEKLAYLKDLERKMKALIIEWKRAEDKQKVIGTIQALLFRQKEKMTSEKQQKKFNEKFEEVGGEIKVGDKVRMRQNRQVAVVKELKGKKAMLQLGNVPLTVSIKDLILVKEKPLQ